MLQSARRRVRNPRAPSRLCSVPRATAKCRADEGCTSMRPSVLAVTEQVAEMALSNAPRLALLESILVSMCRGVGTRS